MARMAYDYRMEFRKDVILDIICYRKRGHNEGDDPSMTQPIMYSLVEGKRSTRQLYREALLGRGDISDEEAAKVEQDFHTLLEQAFKKSAKWKTRLRPRRARPPIASACPPPSKKTPARWWAGPPPSPRGASTHR